MPGGLGGGHLLPTGWVQPRPSDDLVDSVAMNVPWTNFDYRRPGNGPTDWGPKLAQMRIRYLRTSYGHDAPTGRPTWQGGGGGRVQNKTADRAMFRYLESIGLRAGHCIWVGNSLATETYADFLEDASRPLNDRYPIPAWFEGLNEPPFFNGAFAIPLYTRYNAGLNRGTITAGAAYAVGDYGQDATGYNYTCIAATGSLPAGQVPGPVTGYYWGTNFAPSWAVDCRWFHQVAVPALRAIPGWANVPFVGNSMYENLPTAQGGDNNGRSFDDFVGQQTNGIDGRNSHKYQLPGSANYDIPGAHFDQFRSSAFIDEVTNSRAWYLTECGAYRGGPATGMYTCTEQAQSTLTLRLVAYAFEVGVTKTVLWELCDEPSAWFLDSAADIEGGGGFLFPSGAPKKVAYDIERMLALLEDPGPTHRPRALRPLIVGAPADMRTTWVAKRDGRVYFLYWLAREVTTDPTGATAASRGGTAADGSGVGATNGDVRCNAGSYASGTYVAATLAPFTLAIASQSYLDARNYQPDVQTSPVARFGPRLAGTTISLNATERVQILELIP